MTSLPRHRPAKISLSEHRLLHFGVESRSSDAPKEKGAGPEAEKMTDPKESQKKRINQADADVLRAKKIANSDVKHKEKDVKSIERKSGGQGTSKDEKKEKQDPVQDRDKAVQEQYDRLNVSFKNRFSGIEGNIASSNRDLAKLYFWERLGSNEKSSIKQDESYRDQLTSVKTKFDKLWAKAKTTEEREIVLSTVKQDLFKATPDFKKLREEFEATEKRLAYAERGLQISQMALEVAASFAGPPGIAAALLPKYVVRIGSGESIRTIALDLVQDVIFAYIGGGKATGAILSKVGGKLGGKIAASFAKAAKEGWKAAPMKNLILEVGQVFFDTELQGLLAEARGAVTGEEVNAGSFGDRLIANVEGKAIGKTIGKGLKATGVEKGIKNIAQSSNRNAAVKPTVSNPSPETKTAPIANGTQVEVTRTGGQKETNWKIVRQRPDGKYDAVQDGTGLPRVCRPDEVQPLSAPAVKPQPAAPAAEAPTGEKPVLNTNSPDFSFIGEVNGNNVFGRARGRGGLETRVVPAAPKKPEPKAAPTEKKQNPPTQNVAPVESSPAPLRGRITPKGKARERDFTKPEVNVGRSENPMDQGWELVSNRGNSVKLRKIDQGKEYVRVVDPADVIDAKTSKPVFDSSGRLRMTSPVAAQTSAPKAKTTAEAFTQPPGDETVFGPLQTPSTNTQSPREPTSAQTQFATIAEKLRSGPRASAGGGEPPAPKPEQTKAAEPTNVAPKQTPTPGKSESVPNKQKTRTAADVAQDKIDVDKKLADPKLSEAERAELNARADALDIEDNQLRSAAPKKQNAEPKAASKPERTIGVELELHPSKDRLDNAKTQLESKKKELDKKLANAPADAANKLEDAELQLEALDRTISKTKNPSDTLLQQQKALAAEAARLESFVTAREEKKFNDYSLKDVEIQLNPTLTPEQKLTQRLSLAHEYGNSKETPSVSLIRKVSRLSDALQKIKSEKK